MSQIIDPSYNARMNNEKDKFGIVFHVPELPSPSSVYANTVAFLSTDGCFYECHLDGNDYVWEKRTFGPKRQFIISVTWLVPGSDGYAFNDEVNTIRQIVIEMKKYDTYFETLMSEYHSLETGTMNLIEACSITDRLIDYVNKYCDAGLDNVEIDTDSPSAGAYVDPPAATCEMLATYLNEVIGVLNPHAGFSVLSKEVEALRKIISGVNPTYTPKEFIDVRDKAFPLTEDSEIVIGKLYYIQESSSVNGNPEYLLRKKIYSSAETAVDVDVSTLREYNNIPLYTKNGDIYQKVDMATIDYVSSATQYYFKSEDVSVVTPSDFNLLRNTFTQFTSDQQTANGKFRTSISKLETAIGNISTAIGDTGLKGSIDKIIDVYLGIDAAEWKEDTKSLATRIAEIVSNITDPTVSESVASKILAINNLLIGQDGRSGISATVAQLKQIITADKTGLRSIIGDDTKGLVKDVKDIKAKVTDLEKASGSSKIQSIDTKLSLAREAFVDISTMFESKINLYVITNDTAPVSNKRYWTRDVEYVDVVNPDLSDGNDYFILENGIYTQIDSSYHVTPGIDLHCSKAVYKYHVVKDVHTTGFERGVVYYEGNLTQDALSDAVWTIIEKSADIAAVLEPDDEQENQGD